MPERLQRSFAPPRMTGVWNRRGQLTLNPDPGPLSTAPALCYSSHVRQIHPSAWLLAVLSAILQVVIFPLPGVYMLSWLAIAPLLVALLPRPSRRRVGSRRLGPPAAGHAMARILSGLRLRHRLVCGNLLLDLRHDAPVRRP